jgi:segregation and condensation protein B
MTQRRRGKKSKDATEELAVAPEPSLPSEPALSSEPSLPSEPSPTGRGLGEGPLDEPLDETTSTMEGDAFALDPVIDPEILALDSDERPGLEKSPPIPASDKHLEAVIEALLFVSDRPLPLNRIARLAHTPSKDAAAIVEQLALHYRGRGIELVEVAGGFQFRSAASCAPFVRDLVAKKPVRLTRAQIETLSICAYRQPITRPEIDDIRGVDSGSALKVLVEKALVKILGRKDEPGRPLLYGTTPYFLEFFGLPSLGELPTLREYSELTDESRALFERKMGENIDTIGDIEIEKHHYTDDEIEAAERSARMEGGEPQPDLPLDDEAPPTPSTEEPGEEADDEDDEDDDEEDDEDDEDEDDEDDDE